jgi:branched-subunit amino acid transport protein
MDKVLVVILGMGVVTVACRMLPFAVLGKIPLSPGAQAWMRYVPIAILSAVVAPQLFLTSTPGITETSVNLPLLAALPTALVGIFTRNLLMSVFIGVSSMALLRTTF